MKRLLVVFAIACVACGLYWKVRRTARVDSTSPQREQAIAFVLRPRLMLAVSRADPQPNAVRRLLSEGVSANSLDDDGVPAILVAVTVARHAYSHRWTDENREVVEVLLTAGANANAETEFGGSILEMVAATGDVPTVRSLLSHGSRIELGKFSALSSAVEYDDVVKVLLEHGANPNWADPGGNTPLHEAAAFGSLEAIKRLISAGALVNQRDTSGVTPLMYGATRTGPSGTEVMKLLVAGGADARLLGSGSHTVLHWLYVNNHMGTTRLPMARVLVRARAPINVQDRRGNTALMLAAAENDTATANLLISAGANVLLKDRDGHTAIDLAYGAALKAQLRRAAVRRIISPRRRETAVPRG